MNTQRTTVIVSMSLLLAFPTVASAAVVSIADARSSTGTVVTVRGTVTVPAGSFASSTFDQGFALQDETGGIYVTMADNPGLTKSRKVRVTGTLADDGYGLAVLRVTGVADVRPAVVASSPVPRVLSTGEVSELTEGLLLQVSGTVTRGPTNDMPYGYSVFIDDGSGETQVFIPASTGVNPYRIPFAKIGSRIQVTGFSAEYNGQFEVLPRVRADIQPLP
jgi:DNA/RNA endonuclease YhcR with UshA esterase domain